MTEVKSQASKGQIKAVLWEEITYTGKVVGLCGGRKPENLQGFGSWHVTLGRQVGH